MDKGRIGKHTISPTCCSHPSILDQLLTRSIARGRDSMCVYYMHEIENSYRWEHTRVAMIQHSSLHLEIALGQSQC